MKTETMTQQQRELARHALGLPNKSKRSYRNRFCCEESHPDWTAMVKNGHATMRPAATLPMGGNALFCLTETGARLALDPEETLCPEDFPPIKEPTHAAD